MQSTWIWVVVVVIAAGALWWWTSQAPSTESNAPVNTGASSAATEPTLGTTTEQTTGVDSTPMSVTVTYNGLSFTPSEVTIKKGGTVTWINVGDVDMWVASAMHPAHTVYSGTSRTEHCPDTSSTAFDQCQGGAGYSFKFEKVGSWGYHDHLNASAFGKVVVVE